MGGMGGSVGVRDAGVDGPPNRDDWATDLALLARDHKPPPVLLSGTDRVDRAGLRGSISEPSARGVSRPGRCAAAIVELIDIESDGT